VKTPKIPVDQLLTLVSRAEALQEGEELDIQQNIEQLPKALRNFFGGTDGIKWRDFRRCLMSIGDRLSAEEIRDLEKELDVKDDEEVSYEKLLKIAEISPTSSA
jgi:Ca2+-binding EF-hand superfamily protein